MPAAAPGQHVCDGFGHLALAFPDLTGWQLGDNAGEARPDICRFPLLPGHPRKLAVKA
jgi:hypothetical protein